MSRLNQPPKPLSASQKREQAAALLNAKAVRVWRAAIDALTFVQFGTCTRAKAARLRLAQAVDEFSEEMRREPPKE